MSEAELNRAKQEVDRSTREIDEAMHHLEEKIDGTMGSLKRMVDRAKGLMSSSKEKVIHGRENVTHAMHQIQSDSQEFYSKAKESSQRMVNRVKADPVPYYLTLGAVAIFALSAIMLRGRRNPSPFYSQNVYERLRPDYLEEHSSLFDEVA